MKVFLMYPDRDFDSKQKIPPNAADLIQDLELNILFEAMAQGDDFLFDVAKQAILSGLDAPQDIRYRQEILQDCLRNPEVVRRIYNIPIQSIEKRQRHWMGIFTRYPSTILSGGLQMLEMFVGLLRELKGIADEHFEDFDSQGFRRFFAVIQQELSEDYFAEVEKHLEALKFKRGVLVSARLGHGNEGTDYVLRKSNHHDKNWLKSVVSRRSPVYSFTIPSRDDHGARALGELRDRGLNLAANAVAQAADHIDNFFKTLRLELAFYMGGLNLYERLTQLGEPVTFPRPAPANERRRSFSGLYDVSLALTINKNVVGNDVEADGKDLVMITGANQGGKSVFLRSIGLAQLMMQCGMFVPAKSFSANLCSGLFTHYKREEDAAMQSGKFDEELGRMSAIVDAITANSLILFNESFAATNEREGAEIARQIVSALLEKRVEVFFVTHLYELAHSFYEKNLPHALFLRADRKRDFRIRPGEPLPTSFGQDLYRKVFVGDQEQRLTDSTPSATEAVEGQR